MVEACVSIGKSAVFRFNLPLSIGFCLWAAATSALAQEYKEVSGAITDARQVSQLRREVSAIVRGGGALNAADQKTLQTYYVMHVIAGMTQSDAAMEPEQYPNWRKAIISDLNTLSSSPQKHAFVRNLIYNYGKRLVDDRSYSPAARYNALLIIGELNEREAEGGGRSVTPAVPYAQGRQYLLGVLGSDDSQEMKVGALIGLARHNRLIAAAGANPDPALLRAFVNVMQQTEPSADGTADGLMWMHRIAIDALGDVGQSGAARVLEPIVGDNSAPMMLRCAAADALGRLDYRNAANLNLPAIVKALGQLATSALAAQIEAIQEHLKENPNQPMGGDRRYGADEKQPEDPFVRRVRRQLKYELICVGRGLRGLQQAPANAATKNAATSIQSQIMAIAKELDAEDMQPQDLLEKIGQPAVRLEAFVKNN